MPAPKSPGRHKHIPQRTCVVCRQTGDKRALIRIVRTVDEGVMVDLTGKRGGRGAYLCHAPACWDKALMGDVLEHALRVRLTEADRARLRLARPIDE